MSTHTTPEYRCPACNQPLHIEDIPGENEKYMYCAYGPCLSLDMNDGVEGTCLHEMYEALKEMHQEQGE